MVIWAAGFVLAALIVGWLLGRRGGRVQYVDTSGSFGPNMRTFSDVWRGKTLNFDIDGKHAIVVPHVTVPAGLQWMERVQAIFSALEKDEGNMSYPLYRELVRSVYRLTAPFGRFGYRRALVRRAIKDYVWFLDIVEQIIDFWTLVDKKKKLLAKGKTLKQTDGYTSTWDSWKLVGGKRVITPRFAS